MSLQSIAALSRELGSNPDYVLSGGGNTSFKCDKYLYIKPSGVPLASMQAEDMVKMDRKAIRNCIDLAGTFPPEEREKEVLRYTNFSVLSSNGRRPSVEAPLHELFRDPLVAHFHPALVNAMTCGVDGREICRELFPDAMWLDACDPGAALAVAVKPAFEEYITAYGHTPKVLFLQNHGVFVSGETAEEIKATYLEMFDKLSRFCREKNIDPASPLTAAEPDWSFVEEYAPVLRGLLAENGVPAAVCGMELLTLPKEPFSPDHIVYAKSFPLITDTIDKESIEAFKVRYGYAPRMILVPGKALFAAGKDVKAMRTVRDFIRDGAKIEAWSHAFGGPLYLSEAGRSFIENWEAESYRSKMADSAGGVLRGKIALVTGGAQGFGYGISEELIKAGAHVIVADLNLAGAEQAAQKLGSNASALAVDVSNEESVAALVANVAREFGGVDLLVSNAGVLKAGSVKTFDKRNWDFVTAVNYTGYFLCVKHFSGIMARQNQASGLWSDIIQVNSKSGLAGSNRNAAYAGGKFGTIGQTQSFALELVSDRIKVNSVCPGNYYDGPLWSDPEKGLFRQYFDSGKVPGAKSIEDVRNYYLSQTPIRRGCFPADVAKAIIYACGQEFETGQAIPVTGGQIMLN